MAFIVDVATAFNKITGVHTYTRVFTHEFVGNYYNLKITTTYFSPCQGHDGSHYYCYSYHYTVCSTYTCTKQQQQHAFPRIKNYGFQMGTATPQRKVGRLKVAFTRRPNYLFSPPSIAKMAKKAILK